MCSRRWAKVSQPRRSPQPARNWIKMPEGLPVPKFEECLQRLEKIVQELEKGDVPLEKSLSLFEEGMQLSSACRNELEQAEGKVEILLKKNGKLQAEPFDAVGEDSSGQRWERSRGYAYTLINCPLPSVNIPEYIEYKAVAARSIDGPHHEPETYSHADRPVSSEASSLSESSTGVP